MAGKTVGSTTPGGVVQQTVKEANELAFQTEGVQEKWGPPSAYGSHSMRRGGVTEARLNGVDMLDIQRHGRWASAAVWGYVGPTLEQPLGVTRNMFTSSPGGTRSAPATPVKAKEPY